MIEKQGRIIERLIIIGASFTLITNYLSTILWSDSYKYLDMANGLGTVDPWARRPFIPFLAGMIANLFSLDTARAFYFVNIGLFILASLLLYQQHDLTTTLVTISCMAPVIGFFGKVLLDSAIFFCVVMGLFLKERPYPLMVWTTVLTAVHPMAFGLCLVVLLFAISKKREVFLMVPPIAVFLIWFMPFGSYTLLLYPDLVDLLYILKSLNVLWLGVLFFRPTKHSLMFLSMLAVCIGFVFFLTSPLRAFIPLAALLGPQLMEGVRPALVIKEIEKEI